MPKKEIIIYQAKNGAINLQGDFKKETIWATLNQIADVFGRDKSVISRHLKNIFKEGELRKKSVVAKNATTAQDGKIYQVEYYNLDAILSVGYRVNSKSATKFRQWATRVLKEYTLQGYTINKKIIGQNYDKFMKAVADVKALLPADNKVQTSDILELINTFASTWLSLKAYDEENFPQKGATKKKIILTAEELNQNLKELKKKLIAQKQATDIFGQERDRDSISGIMGNIFQSVFNKEVYPSVEEKAAHLLYFMVKDHPFVDGNKRNGAFSFVWFLRKAGILRANFSPETLTALTLLIAESKTKDKDKMIGLVLLLLRK